MSTVTTSLVPVPTPIVVKAAENVLHAVNLVRAKTREETIREVMGERMVKTGWLKSRPVTRAEAEDIVDNEADPLFDGYEDEFRFRFWEHRIAHKANETLAKHLLASAKICEGDVMYLGIEDAYIVESFTRWVDPTPALDAAKIQESTGQS
jgi:hypothetical protein